MGPTLEGESLTRSSLFYIVSTLGMKCGCDADQLWLSRTLIPLRWGNELRAKVVKYLGFDPDNPLVKMEVSSVWSASEQCVEGVSGLFAYSEGELSDWNEYVNTAEAPAQAWQIGPRDPKVKAGIAATPGADRAATLGRRMGRVILFICIGMVLFAFIGGALVVSRARHKDASS